MVNYKAAIAVLLAVSSAVSPVFSMVTISPGVAVGLNIANASAENDNDYFLKTGLVNRDRVCFIAGTFMDVGISKHLSISPGIGVAQRGYSPEILGPFRDTSVIFAFTYLTIPLLAKAGFAIGRFRPVVFAGPVFDFLTDAKANVTMGAGDSTVDIKKGVNSVDVGIKFGIGVEIAIAKFIPFIQAGMHRGLTNFSKGGYAMKNIGFEIQTGLKYSL